MHDLTAAAFVPHLHDEFRLEAGADGTFGLELAEISGDHERRPFSLVFRGPPDPVLLQRIYPLEHPELGVLELFIVPIGRDADGVRYEAVFN